MKLEGMTAIITGGAGSIGGATILALARQGADVVSLDLEEPEGQKALIGEVENLGRRAIALQGDITKKESVDSMIAQVVRDFGKIDILVNVAGMNAFAPLMDFSVELWDKMMAINLKAAFLCSVACVREMMKQKKGAIVNIASASGHRVAVGSGAFGPSKAGLINLTKQMALEWAEHNIRVNCVSPGPVRTPNTAKRIEESKELIAKIPLGRVAEMDEISKVVLFLASDDSSYMTSETLVVDGGGVQTWWLYP